MIKNDSYKINWEEANKKVAPKIEKILAIDDFTLSVEYLQAIHKYLFTDILPDYYCGKFRQCNLTRQETILNGLSIQYTDYHAIKTTLEYDFNSERKIDYRCLSQEKQLKKIADFCIRIWECHPFIEGNTRTISIFIEKYLRSLGYNVDNNMFKDRSYHFRDTLVKGNYCCIELGIYPDVNPLMTFFEGLIYSKNRRKLEQEELKINKLFDEKNPKVRKKLLNR